MMEQYGDLNIVQENYQGLKSYIDLLYGKVQQEGLGNLFSFYGKSLHSINKI